MCMNLCVQCMIILYNKLLSLIYYVNFYDYVTQSINQGLRNVILIC